MGFYKWYSSGDGYLEKLAMLRRQRNRGKPKLWALIMQPSRPKCESLISGSESGKFNAK